MDGKGRGTSLSSYFFLLKMNPMNHLYYDRLLDSMMFSIEIGFKLPICLFHMQATPQ